ncbi:unnamed protein product [Thlaspi arvense]|uniref:non-specific serine/threonine protein kinase n=1 Tax=Thlaspi arvense TaxID=13288 RepID=A0AAU9SI53_THLAR|nr:unnamed protein product [Thlaspi arvense]
MFYRILWMFFVIPSCVLSASELHIRCSEPFSCGNQNDLSYPFWITGRDECGHPEYKLECNTNSGFPEVSISSVKFTILQANYPTSRIIKLARSEYITDVCPQNPLTEPFNENVLRLVSGTELLTIYYDCQEFRTSTYVGELTCDDGRSYFVTRSLSSPQLEGMSSLLNELMGSCKRNVSVPASGPALNTLQSNPSQDNFRKALREGFEVGQNRECLKCMDSGDACGYNQTLGGFVCYCIDGGACRSRNKGLSSEARAGIGFASAFMGTTVIAGGLLCVLRRRKTSHIQRQHNLKALIPLKRYSYAQPSPSDRPPMNKVVEMIEGSVDALEVPPRPVFRIPAPPLEESSTFSEDISSYTELCSMNVA